MCVCVGVGVCVCGVRKIELENACVKLRDSVIEFERERGYTTCVRESQRITCHIYV